MKSSLVKSNHFIPLLSDTLPYEIPFLFSNRGIYESLKKEYDLFFKKIYVNKSKGIEDPETDLSISKFFKEKYFSSPNISQLYEKIRNIEITIPYSYEIKKNENSNRTISLVHPLIQIQTCDLYKKHKESILFYCNRSPYSLRHPVKISSRLFFKHTSLYNKLFKDEEGASKSDLKEKVIEDHQALGVSDIPSTFFVYEKYTKIHGFIDSPEYLDLEKRFKYCQHLDIARCFNSLYTHTISWAVKSKEYAKNNIKNFKSGAVFEYEFDQLFMLSNYNETNGIPIGAELSRIFAEIILQKIDLNILERLKKDKFEGELIEDGTDYTIRRYIDDYFIFSNNENLSKKIQKICEEELKEYKFYTNDKKSIFVSRPFTTNITSAKQKVLNELYSHLNSYHTDLSGKKADLKKEFFDKYINYRANSNLINKIRGILHDYNLTCYEIATLSLGSIKTDLLKNLSKLQGLEKDEIKQKTKRIKSYLINIINISFYIFCSSPRSHTCSTIFKISCVILEILKCLNDSSITGEIKQSLFSQSLIFCEKIPTSDHNISEFLDILLLIKNLGDEFLLSETRLMKIFNIKEKDGKLTSNISYFDIVVLVSYIKDDQQFSSLKQHLLDRCETKLETPDSLKNTENFLLFFDIVKCPFVLEKEKNKILGYIGITKNKPALISFIQSKNWFFDWGKQDSLNLKEVMEIKEFNQSY